MAKSADAFRTISEVADWLETPAHVLRFWESKFSQVKPVKRAGGRRYYRPADMRLLGGIKKLLHEDGLTIKGVQKMLREQGVKHVTALSQPLDEVTEAEASEIALDVPLQDSEPSTADVVNFRSDKPEKSTPKPKSSKPTAKTTAAPVEDATDTADDAVQPATSVDNADSVDSGQAHEAAPADPQVETPEDKAPAAPAMPSFLQRNPESEPPTTTSNATPDTTEDEAPAPAPKAAKPATPDIPEDPADDVTADPGPLSALARLTTPVSAEAMQHLNRLADQLGSGGTASNS
ncbi:MAG: MerR family transcriptional regulator [Roseovarius sp.]|nr:MerR family transcriptional regulator [Roseovarius sp.]